MSRHGIECRRAQLRWAALLLLAGLLGHATAFAFDVQYSVQPRAVNLGQPVQVSFTFTGIANPPVPELSGIDGFQVANQGRPQVSRNTVIVNGRVTSDITYTYVLFPTREGDLTIGPMNYTALGESRLLPQVTVQVAPAHQNAALFARLSVAKPQVYLHEIFEITLTIYSHQLELGSDFRLMNMPDSRLNFQPFNEVHSEPEMVDGRVYQTKRFQSEVRALAAGDYAIAPALNVPIRRPNQRRSAFDMFFGGVQMETTQVVPEPVTVTVLPLPQENRPDSFTGAVGSFDFAVTAQPLEVQAGDPINLTLRIEGRGNMDAVSAPRIDFGPDFRTYDAQLVQRDLNDRRSHGRILFEQVIIPRSDALEAIPPIDFTFFDPEQAAYRTLSQGPFTIRVTPSAGADGRLVQVPVQADAPELQVLHQDIVYLKPAPGSWPRHGRGAWYAHPLYVAMQMLPALAVAGSLLVARRREELTRDVAKARRLRAPRVARAAVARAEAARAAGEAARFYEAVWDALHHFFGDLFNLRPGEVDPSEVVQRLRASGLDDAAVQAVADLFRECEKARFASGLADASGETLAAHLRNLQSIFHSCSKVKS